MQMVPLNRCSKSIVYVQLVWYKNQPRLGLYLDVSTNPILDTYGKPIPLTCAFGKCGFKGESKSITRMGFTDPAVIANRLNLKYVHLFILNNELHGEGRTLQRPYLDNLINFIRLNLGLDLRLVNAGNVFQWNSILGAAISGKMLVADWAQWWSVNGPFVGPDGTNMALV